MGYIFRSGLHACDPGGTLVFLDIAEDRYFALGAVAFEVCSGLIAGRKPSTSDLYVIQSLVAGGVLVHTGNDARPSLCLPAVPASCALTGNERASARTDAIVGLIRYVSVLTALRLCPLSSVLAEVAGAKRRLRGDGERADAASRAAVAFARIDRLISPGGRCLPRSITIVRMLLACCSAVDLVIGVKLRPFEAHCWAQQREAVVGDSLPNIAPFTPILIL